MPLYMDIHKGVEGLTAEAVAGAYEKDLEVQEKNFTSVIAKERTYVYENKNQSIYSSHNDYVGR